MATLNAELKENGWLKYYMDTPMGPPRNDRARQNLEPGTCVKNRTHCGRVHKNGSDECIVIGHGWDNSPAEKFVWKGTKPEFDAVWSID